MFNVSWLPVWYQIWFSISQIIFVKTSGRLYDNVKQIFGWRIKHDWCFNSRKSTFSIFGIYIAFLVIFLKYHISNLEIFGLEPFINNRLKFQIQKMGIWYYRMYYFNTCFAVQNDLFKPFRPQILKITMRATQPNAVKRCTNQEFMSLLQPFDKCLPLCSWQYLYVTMDKKDTTD